MFAKNIMCLSKKGVYEIPDQAEFSMLEANGLGWKHNVRFRTNGSAEEVHAKILE